MRDKTQHPFQPGVKVAVVAHHWERRVDSKREVHKVHKNGNFTLIGHDGKPDQQQYTANFDGTTAYQTGAHGFRHNSHLELWTPAIEEEILERKARVRRDRRRSAIANVLAARNTDIPEHALHQIETALKFAGYLLETTDGQ